MLTVGRISGDLETAARTCFPPEGNISMSLEAAMLRYCTIMATINEGAETRAREPLDLRRVGPGQGTGPEL